MLPRLLRKMIVAFTLLPAMCAVAQTYVDKVEDGHYYYIYTTQNSGSIIWPSTATDAAGNPYLSEYYGKELLNYTDNNIKTPTDMDYTYCLWQFKKTMMGGKELWQIVNVALDRYMVWICQSGCAPSVRLEQGPSAINNSYFVVDRKSTNAFCIYPFNVETGEPGTGSFDVKGGAKQNNPIHESYNGGGHLVQFNSSTWLRFEEDASYSPDLSDPTIEVGAGYMVSLACTTDGAAIYYTTDGSDPATSATRQLYTAPFYMGHNTEAIRTVAAKDELVSHEVAYYAEHFAAPAIGVSGTTVTISTSQAGATIYYTTDGSRPTLGDDGQPTGSTLRYTGSFTADFSSSSAPVVVRAVAASRGRGDISPESRHANTVSISRSSQITAMGGNYILDNGFVVDKSGIGTDDEPFTGSIDGQRQVIAAIDAPLFGHVKDALIKGVVIGSATISGSGDVGALVCKASGNTRICNCGLLGGSVGSADGNCGSLVGSIEDYSRVVNCYSFASITGGTTVGGIVGHNSFASTPSEMRTLVANCVFYGTLDGGAARYPVYGGVKISNINSIVASNALNLYNYYRDEAIAPGTLADFNCAWPVEETLLLRFEHLRSILNSNRQLMAWYLTGSTADTAMIDKWVLDPEAAPYPVLKRWGRYASLVNPDPGRVWDARQATWKQRSAANPWKGRLMGMLTVKAASGTSMSKTIELPITDMDTLGGDYSYAKVQLPYYNTLFGDPGAADWNTRYGGNYTDRVVTGWEVVATDHEGKNHFLAHWQDGYNFADRECTDKDLYATSGRVFAQGGYYYVPRGVRQIEIKAHWGKAVYLHNADRSMDRVNDAQNASPATPVHPATFNGRTVYTKIYDAQAALERISANPAVTVYDQAIVLVGNYQWRNLVSNDLARDADRPFTLMSVDLDMDEEPDYCFEAQWGNGSSRAIINPIRFDFVAVPPLGLAMKQDGMLRRLNTGIVLPRGHFEITETSFIHFTEFEYDRRDHSTSGTDKAEAPLILNGGHIHRIVTSENMDGTTVAADGGLTNRTLYIIMGGHFYCRAFTPGPHNDRTFPNRHCAVTVLGGEFPEFYLSGKYKGTSALVHSDNPHCYIDGGRFGTLAGGGMEKIDGDVTMVIEHSLVGELYGGGMNAEAPITGSISITIDHSRVGKYCGGPKYGDMNAGTSITTHATGTRFGTFFGGGDGGTNLALYDTYDNKAGNFTNSTPDLGGWNLGSFTSGSQRTGDSYYAQFAFDCYNISSGTEEKNHNKRTYKYSASFAKTMVENITSVLDSCEVMGDYYGAGNLGSVRGNVSSHLSNTTVHGSAFGAGFSASIPTFKVHSLKNLTTPYRDANTGICHSEVMGDILTYTWSDGSDGSGVSASKRNSNPTLDPSVELNYLYTSPANLNGLGQVGGNATITIDGDSRVDGSVFGGGNESAVAGNAEVRLSGNTEVQGSVYGGGNIGTVGGNTNVEIR